MSACFTVRLLHRCYYHGHTCLRNRNALTPDGTHTFEEKYQATLSRSDHLRELGYEVRDVWECEIRDRRGTNPEFDDAMGSAEIVDPLNPRDAFFGV